jgi:cobalt-zinc-cadmium efflux system membrane fusion protein
MAHESISPPHDHLPGGISGKPTEVSPTMKNANQRQASGLISRAGSHLPTILVMALLGGIGVYGHQSGWRLPKFSALVGHGDSEYNDWCEEHGVPESLCVECHPELLPRDKDFGWCKEHGVADCPLCHPEVAQRKPPPAVSQSDRQRAARTLAACPRPENNPICKNYRRRIQFASQQSLQKAGVNVALADRQTVVESLAVSGQITYDQTRLANLSSRLPGTLWRVEKETGDHVHAGDVLALVDAAEVGRAKTELIQALAQDHLQRILLKQTGSVADVVPGGKIQQYQTEIVQAHARLLGAHQSLLNLGLPVSLEQIQTLPEDSQVKYLRWLGIPEQISQHVASDEATANLLPLKAPIDGVVVARHAVAGEVVDPARVLFQVADTTRMWLTLSVSPEDADRLALGQAVHFMPDGSREEVSGKLAWIDTSADAQTRMVSVRVDLPNAMGRLRNETFGRGLIVLREEPEAVVVPSEAVHWEGCCHVVFVRDKGYFDSPESPKVFHVRTVRLGTKTGDLAEIVAGVLPGEVVAAKGSDVLRAELLKNNLGEGCTCCK